MLNQISNHLLIFIIMLLVVARQGKVEGGSCSQALGACGPRGQCDQICKAMHIGGKGSCEFQLCTCYYDCSPAAKICNVVLGPCGSQCYNACCNSKCATQFKEGSGGCSDIGMGVTVCNCQYPRGYRKQPNALNLNPS